MDAISEITLDNIGAIALGATVLGTGGGGDPYVGRLMAEQAIRDCGPVPLVAPDAVPDDATLILCGMMGAPAVIVEKLPSGHEPARAIAAVAERYGHPATHVVSLEAGGINSMIPIAAAARAGLPLVDADGMGRAFPELQMLLPTLEGIPASPVAIVDEKGNRLLVEAIDNHVAETFARGAVVTMGATATIAFYPMRGRQSHTALVPRTISLAWRIGQALLDARRRHEDPVAAVADALAGHHLFSGKVTDVLRRTTDGFSRGVATLAAIDGFAGEMAIDFQNEFLVARHDDTVVVGTPDLIAMLDAATGEPVTAETLAYGRRVAVIGAPCFARWRSPAGLALVGPACFGYDHPYRAFELSNPVDRKDRP